MQYTIKNPAQALARKPVAVRLPADVDRLWKEATASDPSFFLRFAIASCLLQEGWAGPEDVTLLPCKNPETCDYEMFSREELAARVAAGETWIPGWE